MRSHIRSHIRSHHGSHMGLFNQRCRFPHNSSQHISTDALKTLRECWENHRSSGVFRNTVMNFTTPIFFKADVHEILIGTQGFSKNTKQWLLGFGQQGASFLMAAQCSKEVPSASLACAAVPGSEIHDQFLGKNRGTAQKNEMYKQSHMINIAIIIQDIICVYIYIYCNISV